MIRCRELVMRICGRCYLTKNKIYSKFSKQLKDVEFAVEYLNASLEDNDAGSDERFLMALRQVAQAQGGMTEIATKSGMARPALYRALSENGNPEFLMLKNLLDSLGLKLAIEQREHKKQAS
jgi:probable addiction module antidote protein